MIAVVVNHLWQSTLFVLGAALLALVLRRCRPGVRYGIWLAASLKFLLPFALLAAAGDAAAGRLHLFLAPPKGLAAIAPVVEPLPQAFLSPAPPPSVVSSPLAAPAAAVPFDPAPVLLGVWAIGLAVVLGVWAARWSRVRAALRDASPMDMSAPVQVLSTPLLMEPGVAGFLRPVLVLPEGIAERLSPAQLDAIVAHELCHVRRRDNLTGALHMLVQALFWFHPLVWWLGARLVAEREQACDEAVVRAGHGREAYARGVIETCRHYLQSPLVCVSGVSGADLQQRVEAIMTHPESAPLSLAAKALLGAAATLALASPVAAGVLAAQSPAMSPAPAAPPASAAASARSDLPVAETQPAEAPRPIVLAQAQAKPQAPAPAAPPANPATDEVARRLAEQQQPRAVAPFDPARFDRYVGYYQLGPNAVFKISRDGPRFFTQLTGQGPVEIYPESDAKFFATVVAAQISFNVDANGAVTGLVLHQNGLEQPAPRIDEAKVKAAEAALAQRIASNTPAPGTEAIVRRVIESEEAGAPDYSDFGPGLLQAARSQQERMAALVKGWGPLVSIKFSGVTPQGMDRYTVTCQNAVFSTVITPLGPDGKVNGFAFVPYQPGAL
jgi:beta-lactamase regulating signal transducer with metallopeptidase domain